MKLIQILNRVIQESINIKLDEYNSILFEESEVFNELADPSWAYEYALVEPNNWEFTDRYGNTLGVFYNQNIKYFESYYVMKDLNGNVVKVFDYEQNKSKLDSTSFQGGSDEHRSDTICAILINEVIPMYLNNIGDMIKFHPINDYRFKIFWKCAEISKEKYPFIEIKQIGKEIYLIRK